MNIFAFSRPSNVNRQLFGAENDEKKIEINSGLRRCVNVVFFFLVRMFDTVRAFDICIQNWNRFCFGIDSECFCYSSLPLMGYKSKLIRINRSDFV